jgi:hypothetical protein
MTSPDRPVAFPSQRIRKKRMAVIILLKNIGIFMARSNIEDYTIRIL